ncbi:MAG: hypothetical protein ABJE10_11100 [bacterium]
MSRLLKSSCTLLVLSIACASHIPLPMTSAQLAERGDARALISYLGQRDASASVCDLRAGGPHVPSVDISARDDLLDGLRDGRIAPELWRDCVDRLVRSTDREIASSLLDAVARSYVVVIDDDHVEDSPLAQAQLSAMQAVLMDRQNGVAPHFDVAMHLLAYARSAIAKHRIGPVATRNVTELVGALELENGLRDGRPVDVAALDALLEQGDETTLRHAALRLPDAALRAEAQRRVIRLHIRVSQYQQVRGNAAAVEETVLRIGANPVAIAGHRPIRVWIDTIALSARGVRVRQDVEHRTSTLLGDAIGGRGVSVLPRVSLRGAFNAELEGIDHPVTVCAAAEDADPAPCVQASDIGVDSRLVTLDPDGTLRFAEHLTARETASLAAAGRRLVVPLTLGGTRAAALDWDLQFETPADLVFTAKGRRTEGPDLQVRVEQIGTTGRVGYTVGSAENEYTAIVERGDVGKFHVVSRGADGDRGSDGSSGHDGSTGTPGNSASCPSTDGTSGGRGEDGGAGSDGSNGSAGGRGGNVVVDIVHADAASTELLALLRGTMLSEGGSGGAGGSGGSGGHGGAGGTGGSGTTCFDAQGHATSLSGGIQGTSGSDGRSGMSGSPGSSGEIGSVTIRVVP